MKNTGTTASVSTVAGKSSDTMSLGVKVKKKKQKFFSASQNRLYGTGRRKSSVARVWIAEGTGRFLVNRRSLSDYFSASDYVMPSIVKPFAALGVAAEKYDVFCTVKGGGTTGQSQAIMHGISRALVCGDNEANEIRKALKVFKLLTRDSREVERKKYGLRGARKSTQFSKR
ncbi:30S ribosomal protein S9 [Candidatus Fokinia solitaria]|uniref:Small ribosomal subunit protein uS9 n=1 Tax=Candidatus Fokinia solitaria TaxID=1802984 RepID=A0A2U8BSF3_9RICK|nr:30S ribosomal protein S9 [Candidatus Fokinia solitaria]AWD33228.1 30S ribosomal protein S9 [Candidatus Fokinia solitaria]